MRDERGYATALGLLLSAVLILLVAALYDVYTAYRMRVWGYEVASEAARYACVAGQRWPPPEEFYETGRLPLDPVRAEQAARDFVAEAMAREGVRDYRVEVRVITDPDGGTVPGFPPVSWASLDGREMHLTAPGVGVYLEFAVPTVWSGLLARDRFTVHVFAAAQVDRRR